jgi:chromosome segregation ATPase
MGGFAESMGDFWEGVAGFLTLGGRHFANKIGCLIRGIRVRNLDKKIALRQTELGRRAWSLHALSAETFPVVDKIDSFERAMAAKEEALEEVRARIENMQKQRQEHLALYQNKISEQLKQKQPVEDEYTGQLVEARRLKRELDSAKSDVKSLAGKLQLQKKRLEELVKTNGERS